MILTKGSQNMPLFITFQKSTTSVVSKFYAVIRPHRTDRPQTFFQSCSVVEVIRQNTNIILNSEAKKHNTSATLYGIAYRAEVTLYLSFGSGGLTGQSS